MRHSPDARSRRWTNCGNLSRAETAGRWTRSRRWTGLSGGSQSRMRRSRLPNCVPADRSWPSRAPRADWSRASIPMASRQSRCGGCGGRRPSSSGSRAPSMPRARSRTGPLRSFGASGGHSGRGAAVSSTNSRATPARYRNAFACPTPRSPSATAATASRSAARGRESRAASYMTPPRAVGPCSSNLPAPSRR